MNVSSQYYIFERNVLNERKTLKLKKKDFENFKLEVIYSIINTEYICDRAFIILTQGSSDNIDLADKNYIEESLDNLIEKVQNTSNLKELDELMLNDSTYLYSNKDYICIKRLAQKEKWGNPFLG